MESSEKRNSTTTQVQQDIEHFKEQYLHSLGLNLSRATSSSPFSPPSSSLVFLRRDSLSSVDTRRDSLSSSSSLEDSVLFSPSREDVAHADALSSCPAHVFKSRINDCASSLQSAAGSKAAYTSFIDASHRDKLKGDYIKSLGLSHRPPRPKGLPCLKDRVNEFETLMAKSASSVPKETQFTNSKNTAQQNICQKLPNTFSSVDHNRHSLQMISKDSFATCMTPCAASGDCGTDKNHPERSHGRHGTLSGVFHSGKETAATAICLPIDSQRGISIPDSNDHFQVTFSNIDQASLDAEFPVSPPPDVSVMSLTSPTGENNAYHGIRLQDKRIKVERALSLGSRWEIFEKRSTIACPNWDSAKTKLIDVTPEHPVIHKAYTEKEKAFILESFRKSGGRQQRTHSLGSCMTLQSEIFSDDLTSKTPRPSLSRLPCQLAQSVTKIVSQFENIDHCEPAYKIRPANSDGKVVTGEKCDKQVNCAQSVPYGSEEKRVQTLPFSGDTHPECVQLSDTRIAQRDEACSDTSLEEEYRVKEVTFGEAALETDLGTEQDNRERFWLDKCDAAWRENRTNQIRRIMEDSVRTSPNCSENTERIIGDLPKDPNVPLETYDSPGDFEGFLYQNSSSINSLDESEVCEREYRACALSVEITDDDSSRSDINNFCREKCTPVYNHENRDSILVENPLPDPDWPVLKDKPDLVNTANVNFEASQSVVDIRDGFYLCDTNCSHSHISNSSIINASSSIAGNELEISSFFNLTGSFGPDLCKASPVICERLSVSPDIVEDNFRSGDKNRNEHGRKNSLSLDDGFALRSLETNHEEGNLTEVVNLLPESNISNRTGETCPRQSDVSPTCAVDELEELSKAMVDKISSDEGNRSVSINSDKANVEQTPNSNHIFDDMPSDKLADGCVQDDTFGRCFFQPIAIKGSVLGVDTFDSNVDEQKDVIAGLSARNSADETANDYILTERQDTSALTRGDVINQQSEIYDDVGPIVEDWSSDCLNVINDQVINSSLDSTTVNCPFSNISPENALVTTYSENGYMSHEREEFVQNIDLEDLQKIVTSDLAQAGGENDIFTRETCSGTEAVAASSSPLQRGQYSGELITPEVSAAESETFNRLTDDLCKQASDFSCNSHNADSEDGEIAQYKMFSEHFTTTACFCDDLDTFLQSGECERNQQEANIEELKMTYKKPNYGDFVVDALTSTIDNYAAAIVDGALQECESDFRMFSRKGANDLTESHACCQTISFVTAEESDEVLQVESSLPNVQGENKNISDQPNAVLLVVGGENLARDNLQAIREKSDESSDSGNINWDNINSFRSCCGKSDSLTGEFTGENEVEAKRCMSSSDELQDSVPCNGKHSSSIPELSKTLSGASIASTEAFNNLSVLESGVFCVRGSYSDISGSVDSFYSGISEVAESFHSADDKDVFEDNNKDANRVVASNLTSSGEVQEPTRKVVNGICDKREHTANSVGPHVGQSQFKTGDEDILEEIIEMSDLPEVSRHVGDSGSIFENKSSDLRMMEEDSIKSKDCYEDHSCESDKSVCLTKHDVAGQGLLVAAGADHARIRPDDTGEFEDCVQDVQISKITNTFDDTFSSFSLTENTEEYNFRDTDALDVFVSKAEEIDLTGSGITTTSSECNRDETHTLLSELDIWEKTGTDIYFVEETVNNFRHEMFGEDHKDKESDELGQEHMERQMFNKVGVQHYEEQILDERRNSCLVDTSASSDKQVVTHFDDTVSGYTESEGTFDQGAKNHTVYDNLAPCFSAEEKLFYQSDPHSSDSSIVTAKCPDSETASAWDVSSIGNYTFTERCDKQLVVQFSNEVDKEISVCCAENCVVGERDANIQLVSDKSYDSNTESCDDGLESMDRDSLEEDIDYSREDHAEAVVDAGRPTTTATTNKSSTFSTISQQLLSPVSPDYLEPQNESPPLCSFSFLPKEEVELTSPVTVKPSSHDHLYAYPMTIGEGLAQEQGRSILGSPGSKSKIKEKRWKEAEDAPAVKVNASIKSPRKVNAPVHLDLASTGVTDVVHVDMDKRLESPGASLHRIPSAGVFQPIQVDGSRLDPYRLLERSQSDASLLKRDLEILAADDDVHLTAAESSSGQNISECNRVYLDLSRAEAFERVELGESTGAMMRTSSGRLLETIPQDEELKTGDLSYVYASHRSFSQESSSSMEDLTFSSKSKKDAKYKSCGKTNQDNSITSSKSNLRSSFQIYSHSLKLKVRQLQMGSVPEQLNALTELNVLMEQAWSMPIYGKDLAYELCDILRTESALDIIVSNLASNNRELMKVSARLLEQSLTTSNRRQIAENGLELVVKMTRDARGDCELAQICTGILESLFKTSEDTCAKVIKLGGLDTITYWCRCNDRVTLKNCAIALSNLALYGGGENQQEMAKHKVPEWLFPLAFVEDDSVRYYALLAIGVLVSNKEIENAVMSSGTLALVLPFIDSHDPAEFAERDTSHRHGRSPGWLKRLIPVLSSKREEAQALAAFHFVMEAGIKSEQGRKEVLYKIGAVDPLKWLASTPNRVASKLAAQALKIIGEEIPHKLSQQVPLWTCDDVVHWTAQVGFGIYADKFKSCHVDGDLLLRLTEEELRDSLNMSCAITRKRFLRELRDLKISSDYTSCDPSMLGAWLQEVGEDMSQYTYQMLNQGVDRPLLRALTDSLLVNDCKIVNGIHRMKILSKIEELRSIVSSPSCARYDSIDAMSAAHNSTKTPIDVFISYRRSNGSQLASLLKVHLQLRGFTVFIDIEKLKAGKFDESLLESVRQAKNFIIVLTQNSLDRCMGDDDKKDWVHREITAAIEAGSNIIPLLDNFKWPSPESLPEDMRSICYFNAVRWIHDYQDACVDKLEKFLRGETNPQQRHPVGTANNASSNNSTGAATPTSKQTSGFESPNSPPYQRAQGMRKMSSVESPVDSS